MSSDVDTCWTWSWHPLWSVVLHRLGLFNDSYLRWNIVNILSLFWHQSSSAGLCTILHLIHFFFFCNQCMLMCVDIKLQSSPPSETLSGYSGGHMRRTANKLNLRRRKPRKRRKWRRLKREAQWREMLKREAQWRKMLDDLLFTTNLLTLSCDFVPACSFIFTLPGSWPRQRFCTALCGNQSEPTSTQKGSTEVYTGNLLW